MGGADHFFWRGVHSTHVKGWADQGMGGDCMNWTGGLPYPYIHAGNSWRFNGTLLFYLLSGWAVHSLEQCVSMVAGHHPGIVQSFVHMFSLCLHGVWCVLGMVHAANSFVMWVYMDVCVVHCNVQRMMGVVCQPWGFFMWVISGWTHEIRPSLRSLLSALICGYSGWTPEITWYVGTQVGPLLGSGCVSLIWTPLTPLAVTVEPLNVDTLKSGHLV